jgi:phosphoketolase
VSRLHYFTNCPAWTNYLPVGDLNLMTEKKVEISRRTFLKRVDPESMKRLEESIGYDRYFPMSKDPFVGYYKSTVRGCEVVFFVWSAMEYVFADRDCVMRLLG